MDLGKLLIAMGLLFVLAGLFFYIAGDSDFLFHLPGDIHFTKGNTTFDFPIMTCIVISVVGSILLNLFLNH